MVDPGDWLPIIALVLLGGCTAVGIAGAWAVGRARGIQDASKTRLADDDTHARIERMERALITVSEEIERLGEIQRFALKQIAEKGVAPPPQHGALPQGRVTTPH